MQSVEFQPNIPINSDTGVLMVKLRRQLPCCHPKSINVVSGLVQWILQIWSMQDGKLEYALPRKLHKILWFKFACFLLLWKCACSPLHSRGVILPLKWSWSFFPLILVA